VLAHAHHTAAHFKIPCIKILFINLHNTDANVPVGANEPVLFYAPIAGTPPNPGSSTATADADLVALFDRSPKGKFGQTYDIEINQTRDAKERVIVGLSVLVELVPEPEKGNKE
jgi:hypothetical protein